jgi:hypothetical protein
VLRSIKNELKRLFEYLLFFIRKNKENKVTRFFWDFFSSTIFQRKKLAINGKIPQYSRSIFEFTEAPENNFETEYFLCECINIQTTKSAANLKTDIGNFKFLNFNNEICLRITILKKRVF